MKNSTSRPINSSYYLYAGSIGLITIAEGVETKAQQDLLFELGCNESQGYFTGKPMPAEEFTQLLKLQKT